MMTERGLHKLGDLVKTSIAELSYVKNNTGLVGAISQRSLADQV